MTAARTAHLRGLRHLPGLLDGAAQIRLIDEVAGCIAAAPLYRPTMPRSGRPFSVMMTNCGPLGWVSDRAGYRYEAAHLITGRAWPAIPAMLLDLWDEVTGGAAAPQACLVNYYRPRARMGLHRDEDEEDFSVPVVSVSLGDDCRFRIGGQERRGPTASFTLSSGDVVVLGGEARLAYHGVDRIFAGTSGLLDRHKCLFGDGGRVNLTLRRVTKLGSSSP